MTCVSSPSRLPRGLLAEQQFEAFACNYCRGNREKRSAHCSTIWLVTCNMGGKSLTGLRRGTSHKMHCKDKVQKRLLVQTKSCRLSLVQWWGVWEASRAAHLSDTDAVNRGLRASFSLLPPKKAEALGLGICAYLQLFGLRSSPGIWSAVPR